MRKAEFIQFMSDVAEHYGTVEVKEVVKPEGNYTGLYVKKKGASPVVNVDRLWNAYANEILSLVECVEKMKAILTSKPPEFDTAWVTDWAKARRRLTIRIFDENPGGLYDEFRGAYFCPYITVMEGGGIRVTQELLDIWQVERDEVFMAAATNTALSMI